MLLYSIIAKIKLMIKKIQNSSNHALYISNDLFALKKRRILHIEYLTSNKKNSGIKLLTNIVLTS